jgi:hypothetical protein
LQQEAQLLKMAKVALSILQEGHPLQVIQEVMGALYPFPEAVLAQITEVT